MIDPEPTVRLRCHRMIHHQGVLWLRLTNTGCRVARGVGPDDLDVWGDRDDVHQVLEGWDGEGSIEVLET